MIDLGLPSGLLWADRNIGAASPEESGLYFQWGDTQGYTAEQVGDGEGLKPFDWGDYKWSVDGSSSNFSKYSKSDGKGVLEPEDDAAHVNMGGNWRMPTNEDLVELGLNTDIYLVPTEGEEIQGTVSAVNGNKGLFIDWESRAEGTVKGVKFYKKGDKQTYMFVPAAGVAYKGSMLNDGMNTDLRSSSQTDPGIWSAITLFFNTYSGGIGYTLRCYGCPARGVLAQ